MEAAQQAYSTNRGAAPGLLASGEICIAVDFLVVIICGARCPVVLVDKAWSADEISADPFHALMGMAIWHSKLSAELLSAAADMSSVLAQVICSS